MIKYKDICVEFPWSVHIWEVDLASEVYLGGKVRDKLFYFKYLPAFSVVFII